MIEFEFVTQTCKQPLEAEDVLTLAERLRIAASKHLSEHNAVPPLITMVVSEGRTQTGTITPAILTLSLVEQPKQAYDFARELGQACKAHSVIAVGEAKSNGPGPLHDEKSVLWMNVCSLKLTPRNQAWSAMIVRPPRGPAAPGPWIHQGEYESASLYAELLYTKANARWN